MACSHPFPCAHGPAGPLWGLREKLGMEPGAGPTECSGPRPRTADSSQASFPQPRFSQLHTTLKALSGSATSGNTASFLGGGHSAAPHPRPVTPPPPGRARAGVPSHPSQAGPHSLTSSQTPARRPEGEGPLLAGQGALSVWGGARQPGHSLSATESVRGSVRSAL